jgi:baseplate J-like protein
VTTAPPFDLISCTGEDRRAALKVHPTLQGIDYLEVTTPDQLTLDVHFIETGSPGVLNAMLTAVQADKKLVTIEGGVRERGIRVVSATKVGRLLRVVVDRAGDFSAYTLGIKHTDLDPAFSAVEFSFKAGCPSRFDCKPREDCPPEERIEPAIDYLAKDYASFRQALLDYLPLTVPDSTERHEADVEIALLELFAHVGDLISYEQDAVANEAYLSTARRRISVRRHARLADYELDDGASALAWAQLRVRPGAGSVTVPADTQLLTRVVVPVAQTFPPHPSVIAAAEDVAAAYRRASNAVFETREDVRLNESLNEIAIHTWGQRTCWARRGTTELDLVGSLAADSGHPAAWRLRPGSYLLLEEIRGLRPDPDREGELIVETVLADPAHRQVVTVVEAHNWQDPLTGLQLTRVTWHEQDALRFDLCISVEVETKTIQAALARGNLALADHAETVVEWHPDVVAPPAAPPPDLRGIVVGDRAFRIRLGRGPLARRRYVPPPDQRARRAASRLTRGRPRPAVDVVTNLSAGGTWWTRNWLFRHDLLASGPLDKVFTVETDTDGRATLRFGDDRYGSSPPSDSFVEATYRVGLGTAGNIGADALAHLLWTQNTTPPDIEAVRNPVPAVGGDDPEALDRARELAPVAFRMTRKRAVTEDDYARVAEEVDGVQRAVATFRWTGSWLTVFLAVDPKGATEISDSLRAAVLDHVSSRTQTGYDLDLQQPIYAPLDLELNVCVALGHVREDVEQAVLERLGSTQGAFFDPDNFTFGQPLYLSALYAAVEAVPGVDSVTALRFSRLRDDDPLTARPITALNVQRGFIGAGRLEVLRADSDPSRPEDGFTRLVMGGAR